jgi:RNA polymerase sigma-70 factor (ECF subfamily)
MSDAASFPDLIRRLRAGEEAAATELVRRYEPTIRRAVRVRLHDARLRRLFDSLDVCQSVLASFFVRAALGQYELNTPEQLLKLLATMARNKLADHAKQHRAQCRDYRRAEEEDGPGREVAAPGASPSQQVAAQDLLQEAQRRLSAEERRLWELRQQGWEWTEIARELNGTAEALRKQLTRAVDRVARELRIDKEGLR